MVRRMRLLVFLLTIAAWGVPAAAGMGAPYSYYTDLEDDWITLDADRSTAPKPLYPDPENIPVDYVEEKFPGGVWPAPIVPDYLQVGKAAPLSGLWGPVYPWCKENRITACASSWWPEPTGCSGSTCLWEPSIRLLTDAELGRRNRLLGRMTAAMDAQGARWVAPYISAVTAAGRHSGELRGFFEFYADWQSGLYPSLGKPYGGDAASWIAEKKDGTLNAHSPDYYCTDDRSLCLNRYRMSVCAHGWRDYLRMIARQSAEAGYEEVMLDNASVRVGDSIWDPDSGSLTRYDYGPFCATDWRTEYVPNYLRDFTFRKTMNLKLADVDAYDALGDHGPVDLADLPDGDPRWTEALRRFRIISMRNLLVRVAGGGQSRNAGFGTNANLGDAFHSALATADSAYWPDTGVTTVMVESTHSPGYSGLPEVGFGSDRHHSLVVDTPDDSRVARWGSHDETYWSMHIVNAPARGGTMLAVSLPRIVERGFPMDVKVRVLRGDVGEVALIARASRSGTPEVRAALDVRDGFAEGTVSLPAEGLYGWDVEWTAGGRRYRAPVEPQVATNAAELLAFSNTDAKFVFLDNIARYHPSTLDLLSAECLAFMGDCSPRYMHNNWPWRSTQSWARFRKERASLFEGATSFARVGAVYGFWGNNPLGVAHEHNPLDFNAAEHIMIEQGVPVEGLVDNLLSASDIADLDVVVLEGRALNLQPPVLDAMEGKTVYVSSPDVEVNGDPYATVIPSATVYQPEVRVGDTVILSDHERVAPAFWRLPGKAMVHLVNYNVTQPSMRDEGAVASVTAPATAPGGADTYRLNAEAVELRIRVPDPREYGSEVRAYVHYPNRTSVYLGTLPVSADGHIYPPLIDVPAYALIEITPG